MGRLQHWRAHRTISVWYRREAHARDEATKMLASVNYAGAVDGHVDDDHAKPYPTDRSYPRSIFAWHAMLHNRRWREDVDGKPLPPGWTKS